MEYEEFKRIKDAKQEKMRAEAKRRGDIAYNEGLWRSVKWLPWRWWIFVAYHR